MERSEITPRFGVCPIVLMVKPQSELETTGEEQVLEKPGKFPQQGNRFSPSSFYFLLIRINLQKEPICSTLNSIIRESPLHVDAQCFLTSVNSTHVPGRSQSISLTLITIIILITSNSSISSPVLSFELQTHMVNHLLGSLSWKSHMHHNPTMNQTNVFLLLPVYMFLFSSVPCPRNTY